MLARLRNPKTGQTGGVVTVGDWLAHWLVSRTSPAASTVRGYAAHVRLYLGPYLGEVLLTELTVGQVQAMFTAIIRQHQALGTPVSAATLTRIRATRPHTRSKTKTRDGKTPGQYGCAARDSNPEPAD